MYIQIEAKYKQIEDKGQTKPKLDYNHSMIITPQNTKITILAKKKKNQKSHI